LMLMLLLFSVTSFLLDII